MRVELGELMQEPAGGENHGRAASTNPEVEGRQLPLDVSSWQAAEVVREGGYGIVEAARGSGRTGTTYGGGDAGMTAHRGVLHPDEYVDESLLQIMVERRLGFSYEQIRSVYRQGPLGADQRELRGKIDARLLALSRSGGSMAELARALGFQVKDNGTCRVIENALARARQEEHS